MEKQPKIINQRITVKGNPIITTDINSIENREDLLKLLFELPRVIRKNGLGATLAMLKQNPEKYAQTLYSQLNTWSVPGNKQEGDSVDILDQISKKNSQFYESLSTKIYRQLVCDISAIATSRKQ